MTTLNLKPTHAPVKAYYEALDRFGRGNFDNEGNIRGAFERLLEKCAHQFDWTVVPEYQIARKGQHPIRADAGLIDAFNLPRGYWEAKDSKDDLKAEIHKKFEAGYPRTNILFQSPAHATLYQNGIIAFDDDITTPEKLVEVLRYLFEYRQPNIEEWEDAVGKFSVEIPNIAAGAMKLIAAERKTNKAFIERFTAFADVCRESINPDLKDDAVEKMLVQHLLTERIFRRFTTPTQKNSPEGGPPRPVAGEPIERRRIRIWNSLQDDTRNGISPCVVHSLPIAGGRRKCKHEVYEDVPGKRHRLCRVSGMTRSKCPLCKDYHPTDEGIVFFRREFVCSRCGESWSDIWCADCNDRCPRCNTEMEPDSDLTESFVCEEPVLDSRAQSALGADRIFVFGAHVCAASAARR